MLLLCCPLFLSAVVKLFQLQCCAMVHTAIDRHVTSCLRITYVLVQKCNVGTLLSLWFTVCHIHVTSTGAHASLASYTMLINMHHLSLPPSLPLSLSLSPSLSLPPSLSLSLPLFLPLSLFLSLSPSLPTPPPQQHYLATCLL